jgi:hypothetical protein
MKKAILGAAALWLAAVNVCFGAPLRFEKLSEHCYLLQSQEQGNVAAIVTDEGVLIINPPSESALPGFLEALKRLSLKPVRWVAFTDFRYSRNAGAKYLAERGAVFIASSQFRTVSKRLADPSEAKASFSWLYFNRQMRLFPAGLEVRIIAVQSKARSGGDIVVFAPAEKILITGALFEFARYPEIDTEAGGDALGWIDGMKQVVASVPLLKSAIPPKTAVPQAKPLSKPAPKPEPKPAPSPTPEKTLEEGITIVSARGGASNLQNVKDVLESAQNLRDDLSRRVKSGRTCDDFLVSVGADPFRNFGNLDDYLAKLCRSLGSENK